MIGMCDLLGKMGGAMPGNAPKQRSIARVSENGPINSAKAKSIERWLMGLVDVDITIRRVMRESGMCKSYVSRVLAQMVKAGRLEVKSPSAGTRPAVYRVVHIPR